MTRSTSRPVIYQCGPLGGTRGGMATVVTQYAESLSPYADVRSLSTWHPNRLLMPAVFAATVLRLILARRTGVAHLHTSQRGSLVRTGVLGAVATARGHRVVVTVHGSRILDAVQDTPALVTFALRWAQKVAVLLPEVSEVVQAFARRVDVIPNVIEPRPLATEGRAPATVFMAGGIGTRKGVDLLLTAVQRLRTSIPDVELRLAGPLWDVDRSDLRQPGVEWLGRLPHEQVLEELRRCAVAALPSRAEGMPMFVLEAMSLGTPVVTSALPGCLLAVGDSRLAPGVGDVEELTDALGRLLADPVARREAGAQLWRRSREHFNAERLGERLLEWYGDEHATAAAGP